MIRKEGKMEQKRQINKHRYSSTLPRLLSNKYSHIILEIVNQLIELIVEKELLLLWINCAQCDGDYIEGTNMGVNCK